MKPSRFSTLLPKVGLAVATVVLAGCSLQPVAVEISQARTAIQEAAAPAHDTPELERARTKLALAQHWADAKDYGPARWLAEQAGVDAELALARAASIEARRKLARLEESRAAVVRTSYPRMSSLTETTR